MFADPLDRPVEFTKSQPLLRPDAKGVLWTVEEKFIWYFDEKYSGRYVIVPEGFVSDLASVPKALRFIVPHTTAPAASIVHDYCYRHPFLYYFLGYDSKGEPLIMTEALTRSQIDINFREMLLALDVPAWRANTMYAGVVAGGWKPYNKYRREMRLSA